MTVELWLRIPAYPSNPAEIMNKKDRDGGFWHGFTLHLQNGALEFGLYAVNTTVGVAIQKVLVPWTVVPLNTWVHIAGVYDGSSLAILVDGAIAGSVSMLVPHAPSVSRPLRLGLDSEAPTFNPSTWLQGEVDDVRFWNIARSPADIAAFAAVPIAPTPGLVGLWRFDGNAADSAGGHHGTIFGGAMFQPSTSPVGSALPLGSCGAGNVGVGLGGPFDVLLLNGSAGLPSRVVTVGISQPFTISMLQPTTNPLFPSPFGIGAYIGIPGSAQVTPLPFGIGTLCIPSTLLTPGYPGAFMLTNNFDATFPQFLPSTPAPWSATNVGLPFSLEITFQGVVFGTPAQLQATNALVLRIQ